METKIINILSENTPVEASALYKLFPGRRREVSSAISQLTVEGDVVTYTRNSRLYIVKQLLMDKKKADQRTVYSWDGKVDLIPKVIPRTGDWVVRTKGESGVMYFCGNFTRDQARSAYKKITKCAWEDTRIKRYHKTACLREAKCNYN